MHTPGQPGEPLVKGTGNLKHIFKTGLPPGVEREDVTDPGSKALREQQKAERDRHDDSDNDSL